jgi:hypothetical protein
VSADEEYLEKLRSLQVCVSGDPGGHTIQLPKGYRHAKRFRKDGTVCWTSKQEARDIASRAQDHGEVLDFDR